EARSAERIEDNNQAVIREKMRWLCGPSGVGRRNAGCLPADESGGNPGARAYPISGWHAHFWNPVPAALPGNRFADCGAAARDGTRAANVRTWLGTTPGPTWIPGAGNRPVRPRLFWRLGGAFRTRFADGHRRHRCRPPGS